MNAEELAHLTEDIVQTWPAGTRGRIWTKALDALDHDVARGIYEHLRDHATHAPTPGQFLELARSVTPSDYTIPRPEDTGPVVSPAEYRARLEWRAGTGDTAAVTELDNWRRIRQPRVTTAIARHPAVAAARLELEPDEEPEP